MSVVQYKKYIWLVDTIRSAGKITRDQIDRKWASARINDDHEPRLPDSTFFRYKKDVEELFDIEILCDRSIGEYYIDDTDLGSQTKQWLLSQFAVSQTLDTSRELRDRILYESIPEGTQYLTTIVNAMRDSKMLLVSHLRFDSKEKPHIFYLSPLCMKVFKQRWYVLGLVEELDGTNQTGNEPRIYSLDRVGSVEPLERTFKRPKNFDPQAYFAPFYGVFCGKQYKPEFVRVRVSNEVSAKFLRSLPLHQSQKELESCVFEWYIAPTFDFIQQLRTFGSEIEVLAPQSLRNQFAEEAQKLLDQYQK
jgi:predicted DNA-binding transcriptional regulator YafY